MGSNFKKMVRARMAETGESWQAAVRSVRHMGAMKQLGEAARASCPACGQPAAAAPIIQSERGPVPCLDPCHAPAYASLRR